VARAGAEAVARLRRLSTTVLRRRTTFGPGHRSGVPERGTSGGGSHRAASDADFL